MRSYCVPNLISLFPFAIVSIHRNSYYTSWILAGISYDLSIIFRSSFVHPSFILRLFYSKLLMQIGLATITGGRLSNIWVLQVVTIRHGEAWMSIKIILVQCQLFLSKELFLNSNTTHKLPQMFITN